MGRLPELGCGLLSEEESEHLQSIGDLAIGRPFDRELQLSGEDEQSDRRGQFERYAITVIQSVQQSSQPTRSERVKQFEQSKRKVSAPSERRAKSLHLRDLYTLFA